MTTITNRFPGNCRHCGQRIPTGAGQAVKLPEGWRTQHLGECPTTDPSPVAAPVQSEAATVTFTPTPEQAEAVRLFATRKDLVIQAGAGCLAGGTLLNINRAGKGFAWPIERIVRARAGADVYTRTLNGKPVTQRTPGWNLAIPTDVCRAEGDVIRLGRLSEAWSSGAKETLTLTTDKGRTIRATADHPFLTAEGDWAKLGLLRVGDAVQVNSGRSARGRGPKRQYRSRSTNFHPYQVANSSGRFKVPEHRLVVEAGLNGLTLDAFLRVLRTQPTVAAGLTYLPPNLQVHHEDHNPVNNDPGNLVVLTEAEHHRHHSAEGDTDNVLWQVGVERVASVIPYGEEPTFDIEVAGNPHNFLANGFVVHNTGKTATLLLIAQWANEHGLKGWYGAYNKAIVTDVAKKVPGNVSASTVHSLAYRALGYQFRARLNAPRQRAEETAAILGLDPWTCQVTDKVNKRLAPGFLAGLVMHALKTFCNSADTELKASHFRYVDGLDLPLQDGRRGYANNDELTRYLLPFAVKGWADLSTTTGSLRYWHDCYLKLWALGAPHIPADFVELDEAQDADPVQVGIIKYQKNFGTQVVVVGDTYQVLYEWRGAVDALADFAKMGANVTYLTQSFRFGDAIAGVANNLLGRLGATLKLRGYGLVASTVGPVAEPDAILTRTNAGAIRVVLNAITNGRRPFLVGGGSEVSSFCRAALDLQAGRRTSHPELACFDSWPEVQMYVATDEQGEDLRLMVKLVDEFGAAVILEALDGQGTEDGADVVVTTTHKSKGRQWSRVQVHSDFMPPREGEADMNAPEMRLAYVASTRAQHELDLSNVPHFIDPGAGREPVGLMTLEDEIAALLG